MRKTAWLLVLALLLSMGAGCERHVPAPETEYVLYFPVSAAVSHGPALAAQPWQWANEETPPTADDMMRALLNGPEQEGLSSPFPRGVYLIWAQWDSNTPGKLRVRLSEAYSGLTDISLTLADYAIVLTLAQLEGVETVEVLSSTYSAIYRSHSDLAPGEAELFEPLLVDDTLA